MTYLRGSEISNVLARAQDQNWPRLTLINLGVLEQRAAQGHRVDAERREWHEEYVVLVTESVFDTSSLATLAKLTSLRELTINGVRLGDTSVATIARHLPAIIHLDLSDTGLGDADVQAIATSMKRLSALHISSNNITEVGVRWVARNLHELSSFGLSGCKLSRLPEEIGQLKSLKDLDIANNDLDALPPALLELNALRIINVRENPRLRLPPELATGEQDAAQILAWYFQKKRRLNEAKVLMVGQGGVGKTSLVNAIARGERANPQERKTEKIRIEPITLPTRHVGENLRINIWDFGGQEIMHATHQFFLTKRSVYVLVLDARQGEIESNIHYWLQTIQSFGGDSPVMVVTNKTDAQPLSLNENGLKRQYAPMSLTFFRASCTTLEGIATIKSALTTAVQSLPHVDDELPEIYFAIKEELAKLALRHNYVDMSDYAQICRSHGVHDTSEQQRLLRFLHDLGTVLNFDDPASSYKLGDTNILNPEWVTEGVYTLINNQPLMQAQGMLDLLRLPDILSDSDRYPRNKQGFIIEMMRKFELCFDCPWPPPTLLVPELLSKNEPDVNWKSTKECLNFEYRYTVLPSGILPRFIVRSHHALTEKPTYWRSGVVLSIENCKILVRGDGGSQLVRVSVDGPIETRRSALAAVRDQFKAIHATIPRLAVEERVPLPDHPEVSVLYSHLLRLEEEARAEPAIDRFLPEGLPPGERRLYSARELLSGIEEPSARAWRHREHLIENKAPTALRQPAQEGNHAEPRYLVAAAAAVVVILVASVGTSVFALHFFDNQSFGLLAIGGSLVAMVVGLIFVGLFIGAIKAPMAERLLKVVLPKIPRLGSAAGETPPGLPKESKEP
jgi:internalin A